MSHSHFNSKDPVEHVAEMQAKGIIDASEIHGAEIPGHLSAFSDANKETAIILVLLWLLFSSYFTLNENLFVPLALFSISWLTWKAGRSAWLGWSRLERLHRVVAQEKWEIDHHRDQERDELTALYRAKGFEGKLLEDVIDTLMADGDRLLKVMIEEELGLSLETQEHPLKQSLGAAIGVIFASTIFLSSLYFLSSTGILISTILLIIFSAFISSYYEKNRFTPAIVWNCGIAALSYSVLYYLILYTLG